MTTKNLCHGCSKDCMIDNKDYYMVKDHLWKRYGVSKGEVCMDCFESRLGRSLLPEDILVCPLTLYINKYTKNILEQSKETLKQYPGYTLTFCEDLVNKDLELFRELARNAPSEALALYQSLIQNDIPLFQELARKDPWAAQVYCKDILEDIPDLRFELEGLNPPKRFLPRF